MSNTTEETIEVIRFSGKKTDWQCWEEKFLSRARGKKHKDVLLGKDNVPTDNTFNTTAITDTTHAERKRIREANSACS